MRNKKIWIISEVFYPDETSTAYIMTAIAENLGTAADVHVLCGPAGYGSIQRLDKVFANITIHRLKAFNLNKNNIVFRLLRLACLSFGMFFFGLFNIKRKDKLLLVTNPALSIPLFSLLKKIKGFSYLILVHDVFPENLIPAGIVKSADHYFYKLLRGLFNWSYQKADKLLVLGRDMASLMAIKTNNVTKIKIIENWADLTTIYPKEFATNSIIQYNGLANKIVFLFAGNLGRLQGLTYFFNIISSIKNDAIHFLFIGEGALLNELTDLKSKDHLTNVSFLGAFPRSEQCEFLNAAHFGVVTLEEEVLGLGVPSKTYNILAAGKPIFFIGNKSSEIAKLIVENSCGVCFSMLEKDEIISFFNNLNHQNLSSYSEMGIHGREIAKQKYSKEAILMKFKQEIMYGD